MLFKSNIAKETLMVFSNDLRLENQKYYSNLTMTLKQIVGTSEFHRNTKKHEIILNIYKECIEAHGRNVLDCIKRIYDKVNRIDKNNLVEIRNKMQINIDDAKNNALKSAKSHSYHYGDGLYLKFMEIQLPTLFDKTKWTLFEEIDSFFKLKNLESGIKKADDVKQNVSKLIWEIIKSLIILIIGFIFGYLFGQHQNIPH